ncbi:hypothetical protein V9T40_000890 [Parthenolecanium corni]|uniref:Serine incorporator n=1 Tax=Parthenolecanium corni TaxID=536013 RepID=A0AAN9TR95_9HEMI
MGAVLAVCSGAQLAWCCGSAACSLCCASCPSCRNSTSTRIMYAIMLLVGTVISCIMLSPSLKGFFKNIPFCQGNGTNSYVFPSYDCNDAVGYMAVYRLCFAVTVFFLFMSLIMIGVRSSKDGRAPIQNGFWGIKYLLVIFGVVGAFFIPGGSFGPVWMYFGMIGAFAFIFVQLVLIIDFAHSWAEKWVSKYEQTESRKWYAALVIAMLVMYLVVIIGYIYLFSKFTKSNGCGLNKFFITSNIILSVIVSGISILPNVQEAQPRSGLLQSSVVSLYVAYLTWSALSNSNETGCKGGSGHDAAHLGSESIVGLSLWLACVLYSSLSTASSSSKLVGSDRMLVHDTATESDANDDGGERASGEHRVWDNEDSEVAYSWSFFHLMFACATLYVMMMLTNWYSPNADRTINDITSSSGSMWVKQVSSWLCLGLYTWTLIAPLLFPDRDFGFDQ